MARQPIPKKVRIATYLLPPLGVLYLWLSPGLSTGRKIAGTISILLYLVLWAAGVVGLLMLFAGLQIEWRGGFPPVLTFSKTLPDYDALEANRAAQAAAEVPQRGKEAERAAYWTGFRGPNRDGHYQEQAISTSWPEGGLPLQWRQPIGGGYASFVIADGLAFTIEQRREKEAVTAYEIGTGREAWAHSYVARFDEPMGGEGARATPAYDDGCVYSLGAMGDLFCLEASSGKVLWKKNILADNRAELPTYGVASSPLIVDEKVIVQAGGSDGRSVAAYHKKSGEVIWRSLDDPAAYSSPMLVELAGERQLLAVTAKRAVGLDVATGKLLWMFPWVVKNGNRNVAQPVMLAANRFLLSAGYGTGSVAVEVERTADGFSARELWRSRFLKNKFTSSVYHGGHVYGLDEDILTCIDAETGERKWKDGRYGYGQLLLAGGHLVILAGDGKLALVRATPESHQELARFQAIQGKTWNHPAISAAKLFVRNAVEMACFDLCVNRNNHE